MLYISIHFNQPHIISVKECDGPGLLDRLFLVLFALETSGAVHQQKLQSSRTKLESCGSTHNGLFQRTQLLL